MSGVSVNQVSDREPLGLLDVATLRKRSPMRFHLSIYLLVHSLARLLNKAFTVLGPGPQTRVRYENRGAQHPPGAGEEGIQTYANSYDPTR